jgi:hypothetical protein
VRIGVPLSSYRKATARGRDDKLFPDGDRFRDFICVRVRRRLNSAGGQVQFVRWSDITISDVATSSDPAAETESVSLTPQHLLFEAQVAAVVDSISEPSEDEIAVAQELFPELFYAPNPSTTDADCVCGCVPFPVTML